MFSNKWFSSLSIKTTAKKRKRTLSGILHDVLYTCLSKWPPNNHEQPGLQNVLVRPV